MINRIIRDVTLYFKLYFWNACIVGILFMLLYACIMLFYDLRRKTVLEQLRVYLLNRVARYICAFLSGAYLYIVICIALLSRSEKYIDKFDFSLLGIGLQSISGRTFFAENIIMFIPLGILFPLCFIKLRHLGWLTLAGYLCSLAIELTQYLAKWGRFEFVDLWTNTLGAMLGWVIAMLILYLYTKLQQRFKRKRNL